MYRVIIEQPDGTRTLGSDWASLEAAEWKADRARRAFEDDLAYGFAVLILEDGREYARYEIE